MSQWVHSTIKGRTETWIEAGDSKADMRVILEGHIALSTAYFLPMDA